MMSINPNMLLAFRRLPNGEGLPVPNYQTPGAAGMDLQAAIPGQRARLWADAVVAVPTGFAVEIPHGCEGQVRPRSSMGKKGISIPNAPGTIDCDYRGEIVVLLRYTGEEPYVDIEHGDRIAQLIIAPVLQLPVVELDHLSETARGEGGFGSTGR
jgi:dUTP pyrophosphatase